MPKSQEVYLALDEYAFSLRAAGLAANFQLTDAMRAEFRTRLGARGITVDDAIWQGGRAYVDRLLDDRISRRVFGDSVAKRRDVREDVQLLKALELLKKGRTTAELLALGETPLPTARRRQAAAPVLTPPVCHRCLFVHSLPSRSSAPRPVGLPLPS